ncbi:MAG: BUG/TctC family periplasmic protein, partial [uncultured Acetobacteraceae bacterium]
AESDEACRVGAGRWWRRHRHRQRPRPSELARPPRPPHRRLSRGRPHRFRRALVAGPFAAALGPAAGDREPRRRQRDHRHRDGREIPARRLHAVPLRQHAHQQPGAAREAALRLAGRLHAHRAALHLADRAPHRAGPAVPDGGGRGGGGEEAARPHPRVLRCRDFGALRDGAVPAQGRDRVDQRGLSRRRARAPGRDGRARAHHLQHPCRRHRPGARRQAAAPGRRQPQPLGGAARRAHLGRGRAGDPGHQPVVRLRRARADAGGAGAPHRGRRAGAAAPARPRQAHRGPGRLRGRRGAGGIRRAHEARGRGERRGRAGRRHPHRV